MSTLRTICIVFIASGFGEVWAQDASGVDAILLVRDTSGTAVCSTPGGRVVARIKACSDCDGKVVLKVLQSRSHWLKVRWNMKDVAWIRSGSVGVYLRVTEDGRIRVFTSPSRNSPVRAELSDTDQFAIILSVRDRWFLVKVRSSAGKWVEGWLAPEYQCPEPHTSCT